MCSITCKSGVEGITGEKKWNEKEKKKTMYSLWKKNESEVLWYQNQNEEKRKKTVAVGMGEKKRAKGKKGDMTRRIRVAK